MALFSIFLLPICYLIIQFYEKSYEEGIEEKYKKERLKKVMEIIEKNPDNYEAYVVAGDIYFEDWEYEKALQYYRKSEKINSASWIKQKIKIAEKKVEGKLNRED